MSVRRTLAEYNAAIEMDSTYALAYFQIGELLKSQGDTNGALEQYRRTLRVDPAFADAYIQIGGVYQDGGDLAKAEENFNLALTAAVNDPRALCVGHHSPGQSRSAARQHRSGHRPLPGSAAGRSAVRRLLLAVGANLPGAGAVRSGVGAIQRGRRTWNQPAPTPSSCWDRCNRASVSWTTPKRICKRQSVWRRPTRAVICGSASFTRAVPVRPGGRDDQQGLDQATDTGDIRLALAAAYRSQQNYDQALEQFNTALAQSPDDADLLAEWASPIRPWATRRRPKEAFNKIAQEAASDPAKIAQALTKLGNTYRDRGDLAVAEERYQQALDTDPSYLGTYLQLAFLYQQQDKADEALAIYQRAVEVAPTDAELRFKLGQAYRAADKLDLAAEQFTQAVALDPTRYRALLELGRILESQGKTADAIDQYAAAVAVNSFDQTACLLLGTAQRKAGTWTRRLNNSASCWS